MTRTAQPGTRERLHADLLAVADLPRSPPMRCSCAAGTTWPRSRVRRHTPSTSSSTSCSRSAPEQDKTSPEAMSSTLANRLASSVRLIRSLVHTWLPNQDGIGDQVADGIGVLTAPT